MCWLFGMFGIFSLQPKRFQLPCRHYAHSTGQVHPTYGFRIDVPYHCCHPNLFAFFILQVHQRPEQTCCLFSIVKHTFRACSNRYGIILRMLLEWQGGPTKTPCSKKYTLFFFCAPRFVDIVGVPVIGFWASRHEGMQYNQGFLHMWCSLGGTWILQNPELWKFRILFGFAWPCFLNGCVFFWFVALRV